jgi:hypothetical protein
MLLFIYLSIYPSIYPTRLEELEMRENFGKLTKKELGCSSFSVGSDGGGRFI